MKMKEGKRETTQNWFLAACKKEICGFWPNDGSPSYFCGLPRFIFQVVLNFTVMLQVQHAHAHAYVAHHQRAARRAQTRADAVRRPLLLRIPTDR